VADNTLQGGQDSIATDDLVTLNGASVAGTGVKAQRVKIGFGDDSDLRDVSTAFPLPIVEFNGGFNLAATAGNGFQVRATGSGTVAGAALLGGTALLTIYVTDIAWTNSGATASLLTLVAASSASVQHEILMKAGDTGIRSFDRPWKISTAAGIALNHSVSAATTSWFVTVHGFYA
jgi:hypothetical protein